MITAPKPDVERGTKLIAAQAMMLIQMSASKVFTAILCQYKPEGLQEAWDQRLGSGLVGIDGGEFKIIGEGIAEWIAYDVEGKMVLTRSSNPQRVVSGRTAKIGRVVLTRPR